MGRCHRRETLLYSSREGFLGRVQCFGFMANVSVLAICKGNFWDHAFRIMLSWLHLKKPVRSLRAVCQESRLDTSFPESAGRRKPTLGGKCGTEERVAKTMGRARRTGRATGSCNLSGVGFPRIQNSPGLFPFIYCTGEKTEAQK